MQIQNIGLKTAHRKGWSARVKTFAKSATCKPPVTILAVYKGIWPYIVRRTFFSRARAAAADTALHRAWLLYCKPACLPFKSPSYIYQLYVIISAKRLFIWQYTALMPRDISYKLLYALRFYMPYLAYKIYPGKNIIQKDTRAHRKASGSLRLTPVKTASC